MEKERKGKTIIIAVLCVTIFVMSIGYATLSAKLTINGDAKVTSTWNVRIQSITQKEASDGVIEESAPQASSTTASFDVSLKEPGDYAIYTVTVINAGSIDAVLQKIDSVEQADGSAAIKYSYNGSDINSSLAAGTTATFDVRVEYLQSAVGDAAPAVNDSKSYTLTLDYIQATN